MTTAGLRLALSCADQAGLVTGLEVDRTGSLGWVRAAYLGREFFLVIVGSYGRLSMAWF